MYGQLTSQPTQGQPFLPSVHAYVCFRLFIFFLSRDFRVSLCIAFGLNDSLMFMFTYGFCLGVWLITILVIKKYFPLPWIRF